MIKTIFFFLVTSVTVIAFGQNPQKDTLNTEIINNIVYILHKVEPGQTLYSLVNKYNCSVAEVSNINPTLKSDVAIKVGQTLKFPMIRNGKHVSAWAYQAGLKKSTLAKPTKNSENQTKTAQATSQPSGKFHIIKAGETIFSISKLYELDISYLVEANNISDNKIKVGDKLLIDKVEIEKISTALEKKMAQTLVVEPVGIKMSETGVAEVINTSNRTTKYLALHRTAKVGSNIKVTNEATGVTITAKVVANLSQKGPDENIMLKLSPYAFYKLRPRDSKMRATVEYYLPATRKTMAIK
ncbi:LysM peptidoglycan-binding domain-containing protein [Lacihabitans soyangensis]|uniref:LysM peptidoglycan-binding domain-containing protein n=1 Tax=Lacihabitans soyangensis TaxID=869394 RepID=A0AAE3KWA2_9BACT|nr:LysM peptidoglycan-binding domain-containing protein [Lacihabitans soyangensis]MCP9765366.1 LysM peptidoglycan-binding domain-containing protein [Lacihabitans soyangensis]